MHLTTSKWHPGKTEVGITNPGNLRGNRERSNPRKSMHGFVSIYDGRGSILDPYSSLHQCYMFIAERTNRPNHSKQGTRENIHHIRIPCQ